MALTPRYLAVIAHLGTTYANWYSPELVTGTNRPYPRH